MGLKNNPFYLLKISCNAGRREIVSASEEMSFLLDSETSSAAQNDLINLNKRLSAEINWFIDIDSDSLNSIRNSIENNEPISTDGLSGLSKLNATLFNFSLCDATDPYELGFSILELNELYSALNPDEITNQINQNRETAKLAIVHVSDVVAELGKKREEIRQLITDKLSSLEQDSYVELVTKLAEKSTEDYEYADGAILSDAIDQYEVRIQSKLEESTDEIEKSINNIKNLSDNSAISDSIYVLINKVKMWDILAQPLQLKSQASGMPHEISERLGIELRNLSIYLHNEKNLTKEALVLVNAMKDVFAELGVLAEQFESDSDTLNDLIDQKEIEDVAFEFKVIKNESDRIKKNPNLDEIKKYIERVNKIDSLIKSKDIDSDTKTKLRESLCLLARSTAIDIHNSNPLMPSSSTSEIIKALVDEFCDIPSLLGKLSEDTKILRQERSQFVSALSRSAPSYTMTRRRKKSWVPLIVFGIIIGTIVLFSMISSCISSCSNSSSNSNKPSSSQNNSDVASIVDSSLANENYTVTLNKSGGTSGTSSVTVQEGSNMPAASAPTKSGYTFKGYYSSSNGGGTQYYNSSMKSVHNWDKSSNGTLYAYWEKNAETKFSSSASSGDEVYADIVSIFPEIGIYTQGNTYYSYFVCKCKTSSGSTVWVYMTCSEYKNNFDSSASTSTTNEYAEEVTYSTSKRIHGTAKKAESIMTGLSSDTGTMVIDFSSLD